MVYIYKDSYIAQFYTIFAIILLCWVVWFIDRAVGDGYNVATKRLPSVPNISNSYEFEASGWPSLAKQKPCGSLLLLAFLFIIFNVKTTYLVILLHNYVRSTQVHQDVTF